MLVLDKNFCSGPHSDLRGSVPPVNRLRKKARRDRLRSLRVIRWVHARSRYKTGVDALPSLAGRAGAEGPPTAQDQEASRRCTGGDVTAVRRDVQRRWTAVGATGATVEVEPADRALHGAQR